MIQLSMKSQTIYLRNNDILLLVLNDVKKNEISVRLYSLQLLYQIY